LFEVKSTKAEEDSEESGEKNKIPKSGKTFMKIISTSFLTFSTLLVLLNTLAA
jgi:hypothetical protein